MRTAGHRSAASCCSAFGGLPAPRFRRYQAPFRTAYHQWHRRKGLKRPAHLTRRPTRYSAGGRSGDPRGWSVVHDAVVRARRLAIGPICPAPPRAPHPSSSRSRRSAARVLTDEGRRQCKGLWRGGDKIAPPPLPGELSWAAAASKRCRRSGYICGAARPS